MKTELSDPTCADCVAFSGAAQTDDGALRGSCRFRSELGRVGADYPYCDYFQVRRERAEQVNVPAPKKRVRAGRAPARPIEPVAQRRTLKAPTTGDTEGEITMDRDGLKQILRELLEEETLYGYCELGQRWQGGTLVLKPADAELQAKEMPLEMFFHKIVMVRDRLRVLEAKINGNNKLAGAEKVELQGYVSKAYGTLTTFNALFADKADHFKSK